MNLHLQNSTMLCSVLSALIVPLALPAYCFANPQGGVVVEGQANIVDSGSQLNIHQHTDRAVIDWRSFNIDINEHTQFHQPSSRSVAVNRVLSSDPSVIAGRLSANGNVILINPNGVHFTASSRVDVNGLIATTADISNQYVLHNQLAFNHAGNPDARIVLEGEITASQAGLVGIVAPNVINRGTIRARTVQLASGDSMALDLYGDGLLSVAVSDAVRSQLVQHSGRIESAGGMVELTAAAGRGIIDSLIDVSGDISARAVSGKGGRIVIAAAGTGSETGRGHSTAKVNSTLDVSGNAEGQSGGSITISADDIALGALARLDASGRKAATQHDTIANENVDEAAARSAGRAGGDIFIGGGYQGDGSVAASQRTYVAEGAHINVRSTQEGDGGRAIIWSDGATGFRGFIDARGGSQSGNGGLIEVSGAQQLGYHGAVDASAEHGEQGHFLLDPTDIVISNAASTNVTGASPYEPNADDVASNLNVADLVAALGAANVTVRTRATGSQAGNITVSDAISWAANRSLTLDAHNDIIVNAAITARNALTFIAGGDVILNANLIEQASGANLTFQPKSTAGTVGIAGGVGTLNLSVADLGFIQNGWNLLTIGNAAGTGAMRVNAHTWNVPTTLRTTTGLISIDGAQNFGANAATIISRNLTINNTLTGTGTLTIRPDTNVTMGVGTGAAGTLQLSDGELDFIQNGWNSLVFGLSSSSQALNVNARTWQDHVTFTTRTGLITIAGAQNTLNNNMTITTRNLNVTNTLAGTGTLTIRPEGNTTMGVGTGAAGTLQLSDAELDFIQNGWGNLVFGLNSSSAAMNVNARNWTDNVTFATSTGLMTIAGAQNVGANNLTIATRNLTLNNTLTGTGTLTIRPDTNVTMGVGTGAVGTLQLSDAELDLIQDGWNNLVFGLTSSTSAMNVNARNWTDNVTFATSTGLMTINGAQNVGANNLTIATRNLTLNNTLTGTGTLTIRPEGNTTMGIGTGAAGTLQLSNGELDFIQDGWSDLVFGLGSSTAAVTVNARNWTDNVTFLTDTGAITVNGAQNVGANNLTFQTDRDVALNAPVAGSGTLTIRANNQTNASYSIGAAGGNIALTVADLNNIADGWNLISFGTPQIASSSTMTLSAYNWQDDVAIYNDTGAITVSGAQDFGSNDFTITSRGTVTFNAAVNGSGTLSFIPEAGNSQVRVGGTGGNLNIVAATIPNIGSGWSEVVIGRSDGTGAMTFNGANTWNAPVRAISNSGIISVSAAQNFGANNFTIETNANPGITANISGTGDFTLRALNGTSSIGLGGAGTLALSGAEIGFLQAGWNQLVFGANSASSAITFGTANWLSPVLATTTGNITLASAFSSALGSGTAFTIAALSGANITNSAGAGAITTAGARWLMYADDIPDVSLGLLARDFNRYSCTYVGGCALGVSIPAAGNGVVYGVTPVLSFAGLAVNTRAYDGTNVATLDFSGASVVGAQAGDVLSIDTASGSITFADANVGAGKAVLVTGLSLLGANMGYAITQPVGLIGDIVKATIRLAADSLSAPAGTSPSFNFTYQAVDFIGGDTLGTIGLTGAPSVVGAAGIPSLTSGTNFTLALDLSGMSSTNYNFAEFFPRGVLTVTAPLAPPIPPVSALPNTFIVSSQLGQISVDTASQALPGASEESSLYSAKRTIEWIETMKDSAALNKTGWLMIDPALQQILAPKGWVI